MKTLNDLKTGTKLTVAFSLMVGLLAIISFVGYSSIGTVANGQTQMYKGAVEPMRWLATANQQLYLIRGSVFRSLTLASNGDTAGADAAAADLPKAFETISSELTKFKNADMSSEERAAAAKLESDLAVYKEALDQTLVSAKNKQMGEALRSLADGGRAVVTRKAVADNLDNLIANNVKEAADLNKEGESSAARSRTIMLGIALAATALAIGLGFLLTGAIVGPLRTTVDFLHEVAKGDISKDLPQAILSRKDEIGGMGQAVQNVSSTLKGMIGEIGTSVQSLASSSNQLTGIAREVSTAAGETQHKSGAVGQAAEQMSSGALSAAAGMEQAVTNLTSVASATEEMSATIGDIANNSEKARTITGAATQQAEQVSQLMNELGHAAQEVGKVTETITSISAQTNLLALNATIEAARAGAAGKGFAVVANEIKELATQTAAATEDIKAKIFGIQSSTGSAVADIEKIGHVIKEVSEIVTTIATAIEEQASVTKDIANNIAQASAGVKDANRRVGETSSMTRQIAGDVATVTSAATQISAAGQQVETSAQALTELAGQLKQQVAKFRT